MSTPQSLSDRVAKLRQLSNTDRSGAIPAAEALPGDWGPGRLAWPASHAQSRLWFLQQLEPDLTAYHLPALWRLRGSLDIRALRLALADLIERHPTLRTSFRLHGSEVVQIIHPPAPFLLDGEALGDRNPDAVIEQWLEKERTTPFDLASGRLLRARLLAIDHQHHLLLINHHHIASDGWSRSVLARDLSELYNAHRGGRAAALEPLGTRYHDYAVWQRQRLSGTRLQRLRQYWIPQLTGLEPLELPSDHPRPATPSHQGGSVSFQISPELLAPFEELCRSEGATLQMGLLALLALLLHRYSRQDDFAIGVPIWGRNHPDLEPLIGFFINTLPIRTRFQSQQSFRQLLQQVRASSLAAYEHQELPFEQIVEALNLERDTSRNPLLQVMLQLVEVPHAAPQSVEALAFESLASGPSGAKFDLEFFIRRAGQDGLSGEVVYAAELFDGERMERINRHLLTLLAAALEAPDAPADFLLLLPEGERRQIDAWQTGPHMALPDLCLHQLVEQQVERTPDAIALVFGDQQLTYADVNSRANRLARHLITLGVGPDRLVAVGLERSIEIVVALLAILKAGGAYLPLDPSYPQARLATMLQDSAPIALLVHASTWHLFFGIAGAVPVVDLDAAGQPWEALAPTNPDPTALGLSAHHLAYLIYTSGSTGQPKGVMNEHRAIVNRLLWMQAAYGLGAADAVLQKTPYSFDVSLWELFWPLLAGARLVIAQPGGHRDPGYLAEVIDHQRITTLHFVPSMLQGFLEHPSSVGCTHIRRVICSGEALPAALVERFHCLLPTAELHNLYGPTEAAVDVTAWDCAQQLPASGLIPIGRPMANTRMYVLDSQGSPTPVGVPGELFIGGGQVARGYRNRPELTAERFSADSFAAQPAARMYRTGDLARWLPDGNLEFLGRADFQIKLRGFRIEPAEIEAHLLSHPAVGQVAVLLCNDDPGNPRLVAYWVADPSHGTTASASPEQLRAFLVDRLPHAMVPAAFLQLEAFPLSPNGKLDRKALPAPSFSGNLQQRVDPSSELERQLHGLWAEVLGHSDFGITDNFFASGGHSLAAARLMMRLQSCIGSTLPLAVLFRNPTIAQQAPLLVDSRAAAANDQSAAVAIPPAAPLPGLWPAGCEAYVASSAQSRLWFLQQLEPDLTAYHLPALWRLRGSLDIRALRLALADLIERHPTLRTSFRLHGSEVVQIIHPPAPFLLDGEPLGDRNPDAVIEQWLEKERTTPFDLASGRLLRARLLEVAPEHHLLLINHHHIASDGWSRSVLARDLSELYNAHRGGRAAALEPLGARYHDYAVWQRQRLSGTRLQRLRQYWIAQLRDLEPLQLPTDRARPATPSHRGELLCAVVPPAQLAPFEALCRSEGATLQMGLVALLAVLLQRHCRQEEVVIGIPIWGRDHPDLEPLIGLFVNTLPLRIQLAGVGSFGELLCQVRQTSLSAYDHQELPFEQMVEALNLPRDTSRNPLVQVMLQLIELPPADLQGMEGLSTVELDLGSAAAHLDLELFVRRSPQAGLQLRIVYATDLFVRERIERLGSQLLTLLSAVVEQPGAPLASLQLLPPAERRRIESWQHGPRVQVLDRLVQERFARQVERHGEAIALVCAEQRLSYGELDARADRLARELIRRGVAAERIVAVCLERSLELIVALLAIVKAGGAYLPLDPSWPEERRRHLLRQADCTLLLAGDAPLALEGPPPATATGVNTTGVNTASGDAPAGDALAGDALAYVTYTSGSSGVPKGVAITHASILRLVDPVNGFLIGPGSVVLQLAPVAFDAATFEIWGPLLNGGTLVIAPPEPPSLGQLAAWLRQYGITTLWLTAGLFHAMVDAQLEALVGVRQLLAGGDVLSPEPVQRLLRALPPGHELINGYGPTENTTFTCCQRLDAAAAVDPAGVPIGRPIAGTEVLVLEPGGQPCPIGVPGELHIGGSGLARGYLHHPELSAAQFIPDPRSHDASARLYRSGDLVSWNADGTLAFHGRLDQQIKLRGFRIEPGEIEARLLSHPAIRQALVLLRADDPRHPCLVAYWVLRADRVRPSSAELRAFLAERLPPFMLPSAFLELEALPLTGNGKLDRRALPAPRRSAERQGRLEPGSDLERQLHGLWAEVLGHGDFGIRDHFFQIGGHSLAAAQLATAIERSLGTPLPVPGIFRHPTIADQAAWLTHPSVDRTPDLVTLQPQGERTPLYVLHGWGGTLGAFIHLARALAPDRPVLGLQSRRAGERDPGLPGVPELVEGYVDQILAVHRGGPIHLLGYSAGGWYAHAVAAALLRRGVPLGLFAVLDTHVAARIHRRLGSVLLLRRLRHGLGPGLRQLLLAPPPEGRGRFAARSVFRLHRLIERYLRLRLVPLAAGAAQDPFVTLVQHGYRPEPLPLTVDVFAPAAHLPELCRLWGFYGRRGVKAHAIFSHHMDFYRPELMPDLARALESALQRLEAESAAGDGGIAPAVITSR